jgi:hypothetical protein
MPRTSLGVGLLIGGILPLDLRLAGLLRGVPLAAIGPFLSRSAAIGLGLAIVTGLWLFTVKPREYLANDAFLWKMALLAWRWSTSPCSTATITIGWRSTAARSIGASAWSPAARPYCGSPCWSPGGGLGFCSAALSSPAQLGRDTTHAPLPR